MAAAVPNLDFYNGAKMPYIGLGTWQGRDDEMKKMMQLSLELGYRHFDTAALYQNEHVIGEVLSEWLSSGKVTRDELFITTKLPPIGNRPDDVERFLTTSLKRLQLDYVDLYLFHNPMGMTGKDIDDVWPRDSEGNSVMDMKTDLKGIWKVMEDQVDAGRTKSIGLSNFNSLQIERILKVCRIKPANHQIEVHAYHQQAALIDFCRQRDITVCAYSPLAAPYREFGSDEYPLLLEHPTVTSMAARLKKTPAQVLLRFIVQLGISVIPKSANPERIKNNFQLFDFELNEEDMTSLKSLDRGRDGKIFTFVNYFKGCGDHPEYPFNIPF